MLKMENYENKYSPQAEKKISSCIMHINASIKKKCVSQMEDVQKTLNLYRLQAEDTPEEASVYEELYNYVEDKKKDILTMQGNNFVISKYLTELKSKYYVSTSEIIQSTQIPRVVVTSILSKSDSYHRPWQMLQRIIIDISTDIENSEETAFEWDSFVNNIIMKDNKMLVMYWDDMHEGMEYMHIGALIKEYRSRKKLIQSIPGLAQSNIADIENGRRSVTFKKLTQICDYLGITVEEFVAELKQRDMLLRVHVPMYIRLKEARERAGINIEDLISQGKLQYRVRTVEQMEACGAGLSPRFIQTYVRYAGADFEALVKEYQNGSEPYCTLIQQCLGRTCEGENDGITRKNIVTLEQYLADKEEVNIYGKVINGKFASVLLQMTYYGVTESDWQRMDEYMKMYQQGKIPEVLLTPENEKMELKRNLAKFYKERMTQIPLTQSQRAEITPIYNRLRLNQARYILGPFRRQFVTILNEPYWKFAECNTLFCVSSRLLKTDFDSFLRASLTWKSEDSQIPYYEIGNLMKEILNADTDKKRQEVIRSIKKFQKKY